MTTTTCPRCFRETIEANRYVAGIIIECADIDCDWHILADTLAEAAQKLMQSQAEARIRKMLQP